MGTVGKEFQGNDMLNLLSWENPVRLKGETALQKAPSQHKHAFFVYTLCVLHFIFIIVKSSLLFYQKKNALNKLVSKLWTVNAPVNQSGFKISRFISVTVQAGK